MDRYLDTDNNAKKNFRISWAEPSLQPVVHFTTNYYHLLHVTSKIFLAIETKGVFVRMCQITIQSDFIFAIRYYTLIKQDKIYYLHKNLSLESNTERIVYAVVYVYLQNYKTKLTS